jgi:hypothetical protein
MTGKERNIRSGSRSTLEEGIRLFNAGRYFECHEVLESLWLDDTDGFRSLFQGIIQAAVGLLHAEKGNIRGAEKVLERSLRHLRLHLDRESEMPIELTPFVAGLESILRQVHRGSIEWEAVPRLKVSPPTGNSPSSG